MDVETTSWHLDLILCYNYYCLRFSILILMISSHLVLCYRKEDRPTNYTSRDRRNSFVERLLLPIVLLFFSSLTSFKQSITHVDFYLHRLCRSAWVGRSRTSVCLFVCLFVCMFVRSITQKRMIQKCSNLVLREWPWNSLEVTVRLG